ncbi:MAG: DUF3786 domain-containing protein [Thermoanaerobacteraceae bacterium]|nr:DUF3786 domain-containing protein [Thermoanaerobacteraceae bacterium]
MVSYFQPETSGWAASAPPFDRQRQLFELKYCGRIYLIDCQGNVSRPDSMEPVSYNDRTLILQYLCSASGLPPRGRWLSFLELPEGTHHYAPFQTDALEPLAKTFGDKLEEFQQAARQLGGEPLAMGDAGARIPVLPKLPMAAILWSGDDEFPPRAGILYDAVAPTHLSTASLWVLGVELAHKLIAGIHPDHQPLDWLGR